MTIRSWQHRSVGRWVVAGLVAGVVAACSGGPFAADPYPLPPDGPTAAQGNRVAVGQLALGNLLFLTARPGDVIELVSAEPVGSMGIGEVELLLSRVIRMDNGDWLWGDGDHLETLEGATFTGIEPPAGEESAPESSVLVVGRIHPERAGRLEVTDIRLTYRINQGSTVTGTGIDAVWAVCADDPAPADCETPPT